MKSLLRITIISADPARKDYRYWLHQAKRAETRNNRIVQIINFCRENKKSRE